MRRRYELPCVRCGQKREVAYETFRQINRGLLGGNCRSCVGEVRKDGSAAAARQARAEQAGMLSEREIRAWAMREGAGMSPRERQAVSLLPEMSIEEDVDNELAA